ncbi:hypothetical protein GCM10017083_54630 [Thalassobaculum fulvum]|uniref:Animal haem peroxidase n=1 Tax=Thalassobaculum fulvum TaxID=1633335 RepID=A0A919CU19_9PROT|nr:peroxidase family protein [Thalassobaculum fulvum]GHD63786.1 hypothetical protein GCM10017083_54630 [Thalassobaculum fulvum]
MTERRHGGASTDAGDDWHGPAAPGYQDDHFRNLFGPADPGECFQGYGAGARDETRLMLERLADRMTKPYDWPQGWASDGRDASDNPCIPAGYTYLAQLVAHDLVHTSAPFPNPARPPARQRNRRQLPLMLDSIYGGGPSVTPHVYALPDRWLVPRTSMRLGKVRRPDTPSERGRIRDDLPAVDIPRVACPHLNDSPGQGCPDVLLADPRNDDNLIVSQLTAVFHLLHNAVMAQLESRPELAPEVPPEAAAQRFSLARKVVTLIYRRIVRKDLLRRLLHTGVCHAYDLDAGEVAFIDPQDDRRLPIEFSHAAYRVGHSMVRPVYRVNAEIGDQALSSVLRQTSIEPAKMPLQTNWLVQWGLFFRVNGSTPNASRRLVPGMAPHLCQDYAFPPQDGGRGGLLYIDLVRGGDMRLRSVQSLIDHLPAETRRQYRLLADPAFRSESLATWLDAVPSRLRQSPTDIARIADDPPLQLFLLHEAATIEDGKSLGPLGSTILAEVLMGAMCQGWAEIEGEPIAYRVAAELFDAKAPPHRMRELIDFVADRHGLRDQQLVGFRFV